MFASSIEHEIVMARSLIAISAWLQGLPPHHLRVFAARDLVFALEDRELSIVGQAARPIAKVEARGLCRLRIRRAAGL